MTRNIYNNKKKAATKCYRNENHQTAHRRYQKKEIRTFIAMQDILQGNFGFTKDKKGENTRNK